MLGAIAGDIIGSVFEARPIKHGKFPLFSPYSRFTDDTVLTVAIAHAILEGLDYASALKYFAQRYPDAGYGGLFYNWIFSPDSRAYNSWGNGSAMRVSPVGFAFDTAQDVLREAASSAEVTHNHPEGIKGAQATALAVLRARTGASKEDIKQEISERFAYDLNRRLDAIRPHYMFDVSCRGSVPEALIAFVESQDYEDAIRKGISLGGDSDTIACIVGGIAHAFYKAVPRTIVSEVRARLPEDLLAVVDAFGARFM